MSARDNDPRLHRIEVSRDADGEVDSVRFVCDGDQTSPCHQWPDCGCEEWGEAAHFSDDSRTIRAVGHEDAPQEHCWMEPWFNDTTTTWSEFTELYDGPLDIDNPAVYGERTDWLVSGPVSVTFEGDYMTWEYAATAEAVGS